MRRRRVSAFAYAVPNLRGRAGSALGLGVQAWARVPARSWLFLLLALGALAGCAGSPAPSGGGSASDALPWQEAFPASGAVAGWTTAGDLATYDEATLFDLVDGQADAFFAYNFESVAVRTYENAQGTNLRIEVWRLGSPGDAYGLFTRNAAGTPAAVGNDGDADPGRRLAFWQDRYYVQIRAREPIPDDQLTAFGEAVAAALPAGGERPALVAALPPQGRVPDSVIFFRREISIQDEVWLGDENILGLDAETAGVLARYEIAGAGVYLLAVQYPDLQRAEQALAGARTAEIESLVAAGTAPHAGGGLLGLAIGDFSPEAADELLAQLLD